MALQKFQATFVRLVTRIIAVGLYNQAINSWSRITNFNYRTEMLSILNQCSDRNWSRLPDIDKKQGSKAGEVATVCCELEVGLSNVKI